MILKIFDFKKGNRDRVVSKSSDSSLVKKEREQVKIKRYAGMDGNFLSHAHYRDPKNFFTNELSDDLLTTQSLFPFLNRRFLISSLISFLAHIVVSAWFVILHIHSSTVAE